MKQLVFNISIPKQQWAFELDTLKVRPGGGLSQGLLLALGSFGNYIELFTIGKFSKDDGTRPLIELSCK